MSKPRKTFRPEITDDHVYAALTAAQIEFACWHMIPMGGGTRFVRDPIKGKPLGSLTLEESGRMEVTYHDTCDTGEAAKAMFDNFRKTAGMRAALETLC